MTVQYGATVTVTIHVNPAIIIAGVPEMTDLRQGAPYSFDFAPCVSGGVPPYSYSYKTDEPAHNPPPGMTLSAEGVFSGVPTAAGDFGIVVWVKDTKGG